MVGRTRSLVVMALMLAGFGWAPGHGETSPEGQSAQPRRAHADAAALARANLEVAAALLREDGVAVRRGVETMEASCRRLQIEERDAFGPGTLTFDQALHRVLEGTRRYAAKGDFDEASNEFFWVQKTCRSCHAVARGEGLLPAEGPLWPPIPGRVDPAHSEESGR